MHCKRAMQQFVNKSLQLGKNHCIDLHNEICKPICFVKEQCNNLLTNDCNLLKTIALIFSMKSVTDLHCKRAMQQFVNKSLQLGKNHCIDLHNEIC